MGESASAPFFNLKSRHITYHRRNLYSDGMAYVVMNVVAMQCFFTHGVIKKIVFICHVDDKPGSVHDDR